MHVVLLYRSRIAEGEKRSLVLSCLILSFTVCKQYSKLSLSLQGNMSERALQHDSLLPIPFCFSGPLI